MLDVPTSALLHPLLEEREWITGKIWGQRCDDRAEQVIEYVKDRLEFVVAVHLIGNKPISCRRDQQHPIKDAQRQQPLALQRHLQ